MAFCSVFIQNHQSLQQQQSIVQGFGQRVFGKEYKAFRVQHSRSIVSCSSKAQQLELNSLTAVGPLDGRYGSKLAELRPIFSEFGLIKYRIMVECLWLKALSQEPTVKDCPDFSPSAIDAIEQLANNVSLDIAQAVKDQESVTNHDVKAVEYVVKERLGQVEELSPHLEFVHFCCTSEDINNLSHALMVRDALKTSILPAMDKLIDVIANLAEQHAEVSMLSRTHGQTASPTTVGKELAVFAYRLKRQREQIARVPLYGKMAGAVGNYNAHLVSYADVDWPKLSQSFVESLGLDWNPYVTQIEPHDYLAELFGGIQRFNNVLMDLNKDMWAYISLAYFKQKTVKGEIGSSTMPHKVNPIDFENSEGNLGLANAMLGHLAGKLPVSRWQRDLTDSTALRNLGVGVGHSLLAYQSALKGLGKVQVNVEAIEKDLGDSWEVLAEPIQTVMRQYGVSGAYERLKEFSRGRAVTQDSVTQLVSSLESELPPHAVAALQDLTPAKYVGSAAQLAKDVRDAMKKLEG